MRSSCEVKLMLLAIVTVVVVTLSVTVARQWGADAKRGRCQANLEKVGKAFRFYQNDYGSLPEEATDRWLAVSLVYNLKFGLCPASGGGPSYGDNQLLGPKTSLEDLSSLTALVWDGSQSTFEEMEAWRASPTQPIPGLDRKRHGNPHGYRGANMLLADGHAAFFYARTPSEKLLPFISPEAARQSKLTKED